MQERRKSFAEADNILVLFDRQHLAISPKVRLAILQRFLCQRPSGALKVVANQERLAALSAKVVQALCLVAQSARAAFKMSNVHVFWPFWRSRRARHHNVSRAIASGGAGIWRCQKPDR